MDSSKQTSIEGHEDPFLSFTVCVLTLQLLQRSPSP